METPARGCAPWPDGCRGAVSITFDDGLDSQIELALPLLGSYGLRATFYVNPTGRRWEKNLAAWQRASQAGHEVGNHSISHTCSRSFRDLEGDTPSLETITLDDVERDILAAEERLNAAFPGQGRRSFAYPCYQDYVGDGAHRQSYVPIVSRHMLAGRGRGEVANSPGTCELAYLWSWPSERVPGVALIGMAETCAAQGRWGVYTFHGIGEGHLPIPPYDFEELLRHLAASRERIWVAPVAEVAQRILTWRKGT